MKGGFKSEGRFLNHFLVFPPAIALRSDAAACLEIQFSAFLRLLSFVCLEILFSVGFKINRRSFFFYESYHDSRVEFALVVDSHDARVEAAVVAFCLLDNLHGFIFRGTRDGTGWELGIEDFAQMVRVFFGQATADF